MTIEELKKQILSDIEDIQTNNGALQATLVRSTIISDKDKNHIIDIINFFRDDENVKLLLTINTKNELFDIEKNIKSFAAIIKSSYLLHRKQCLRN